MAKKLLLVMKLLTVKEISELLQAKPSTIYAWAEQGIIPAIKINGLLRFDEGDILVWIEGLKKEPHSCYTPYTQARGPRKGGKR